MINSKGGSDLAYANLINRLGKVDLEGINLFINCLSEDLLQSSSINILWNQFILTIFLVTYIKKVLSKIIFKAI
jgi:hypothetical protein